MKEKRTGELKRKIVAVLEGVIAGEKNLEGKGNLAEVLHKEIGGAEVVWFSNMFRELDGLRKEPESGPLSDLACQIWGAASRLDQQEYFDRRV